MKKTLAKTLRSAFALALALVMVLGTVGTTFAAAPSVDQKAAVEKLIDVLKQYGPDVVEEARRYVDEHGYVEAVKETASELKAAIAECASEHEFLIAQIEEMLEGPVAQLKTLKADAENLIYMIALFKVGGFAGSDNGTSAAAVITVPGFGTIDTDNLDLENFDVDDLTEDQKKAINDSGLLGDMKIEDLSDEQVEALKEAGLTGEINPEFFTEEELKQLQKAQDQLNETIKTIEKTQNTANALKDKLSALKAALADLKDAAESTEDLSAAIISLLKQETVKGVDAVTTKYVELRNALFSKLSKIENAYTYIDDLVIDVADMSLTLCKEMAELTAFVTKDVLVTVNNNKLLIAGAFVLTVDKLGVSVETQAKIAEKIIEKAPVVKAAAEKVVELAKKVVNKIYKAYKDATTADLHISYDFNYVAIGDEAAMEEGAYIDLLNDALVNPYEVAKIECGLIQDLELDYEALAAADLITLGFSTADFMGSLADSILGAETNWSAILPDVVVKGLNAVMDEIEVYVEAIGFSGKTASALTRAIQNYIYNSMAYAYLLPQTIAEIRSVNEDAVLVVVGLDNPLEDVKVSHNTRSLGLDLLSSAVVALTDVYTLAYAMLANNCTYVAAPNARNDLEGTNITVDNLLEVILSDGYAPNAEGQAYICEEIMDALTVSYGFLWGDANLDRKVNYEDSLIVCQYSVALPVCGDFIYLPVCDVTGDGKYNYEDALSICQKSVQLIDKFEVEK